MTGPLVPSDVDLRDYKTMPLEVRRFRDSAILATRSPEEILAAILLWSASWHQVPASSLPNDDLQLAQLAGYGRGVRDFRRVKEGALHGLVLCEDGRYYHPVVAEKAAESWNTKQVGRHKRACDRIRKDNKDRAERKQEPLPIPHSPEQLVAEHSSGITRWVYAPSAAIPAEKQRRSGGIPKDDRRKSRLKGSEVKESEVKGREGNAPPPSAPEPPKSKTVPPAENAGGHENGSEAARQQAIETWRSYTEAYLERYSVEPVQNAKVRGQLRKFVDRVPLEEAPAVAAWYVGNNRQLYVSSGHCVDLLLRDAENLRTEWATQSHGTESEARMADKTQGRANVWDGVRDDLLPNETKPTH